MPTTDARTLLRIGRIYEGLDKLQKALDTFQLGQKRAKLDFRSERCTLETCRVLVKLGRYGEAEADLLNLSETAAARAVQQEAKELLEKNR